MHSEVNKRRAARQKQARKRHLIVALIILMIIALITLVIMCFTTFFDINHISTTGSEIYSKEEIYADILKRLSLPFETTHESMLVG